MSRHQGWWVQSLREHFGKDFSKSLREQQLKIFDGRKLHLRVSSFQGFRRPGLREQPLREQQL
jgi:hypothetical protein